LARRRINPNGVPATIGAPFLFLGIFAGILQELPITTLIAELQ
jgi:hypothetical protein